MSTKITFHKILKTLTTKCQRFRVIYGPFTLKWAVMNVGAGLCDAGHSASVDDGTVLGIGDVRCTSIVPCIVTLYWCGLGVWGRQWTVGGVCGRGTENLERRWMNLKNLHHIAHTALGLTTSLQHK